MKKAHTCPTCSGDKKREDGLPCATCSETGVVWEEDGVIEATVPEVVGGPRDLTDYPRA